MLDVYVEAFLRNLLQTCSASFCDNEINKLYKHWENAYVEK